MISCKALLGMTVIEIGHGIGCGHVMQVVVEEGKKLSFIVKLSNPEESMALIPAEAISGIGSYAAMISSRELLQNISDEMVENMIHTYGSIVDEVVVTIDGNRIGVVTDYFVDQKQEIGYLLVDTQDNGQMEIQKDQIQVVGKEYIIVSPEAIGASGGTVERNFGTNFAAKPIEKPSLTIAPAATATASASVARVETPEYEAPSFTRFTPPAEEMSFELYQQQVMDAHAYESRRTPAFTEKPAPVVPARPTVEPKVYDTGNTFLNEQKNLLAGKRLERDFTDNKGRIILAKGEMITEELIDDLRKIDRRLVVRLAGCTAHAAR